MKNCLVIAMLIFAATGVNAGAQKTLKIGMINEPNTLNPAFRGSTEEGIINAFMIRSLVHNNFESNPVIHLAEKLPKFNKNVLEFNIKETARWDDGTDVICEDFITGLMAIQKFRPSKEYIVSKIESDPKKVKSCKVTFKFSKPNYNLYIPSPLPTKKERKIIDETENEIEYLKKTNYANSPSSAGLANGPYKIKKYDPGYYIEFTKNPYFYGKSSSIEKIQIQFYKSLSPLMNAFYTKEIDLVLGGLTANRIDEVNKIITEKKLPSKIVINSTTKLTHLEFNLSKKLVSNVKFRNALAMMIDPKELDHIVGKDGVLTSSLQHETDPVFEKTDSVLFYKYDIKTAQKLLFEMGAKKSIEDEKVYIEGKQVEINLFYNSENLDRERVAIYLQNQWSKLGIKVNLKKMLKRVLISDVLKKGDFDVVVFGYSQPKLQINRQFLNPENIPTKENNWLGSNYSRWDNKKAHQILLEADSKYDLSEIKILMKNFKLEFNKDLPWLPLYFENRMSIVPIEFKGYTIFPDWESEVYDFENWLN